MTGRTVRVPNADHPISIAPTGRRVVVTFAGRVIADSDEALTLTEGGYSPVQYVPRKHVDMKALSRSPTTTYCPYKGDASYYAVVAGDARSPDAVWTYEAPFDAVAEIDGYLAFYPDRVDAIELRDIER